DGFHADEDPLAASRGDKIDELLVAQEIGADLRQPVDLGIGGDDVAEQRLGAFDVDCKVVVNEKHGDLAALAAHASFQEQQFVYDAFVGAKAGGVAKKTGDGAKLAA